MKKLSFGLIVVAIITTITSCKKESHPSDITQTIVLPANGPFVIHANNQFAFNFLHASIQQDSAQTNKLISPLSIYIALSMVYNGAGSATKDSMTETLKLAGISISDLNAVCKSLITQLPQEDNKVQFSIANSIWYRQNDFQPLPSFVNILQTYYNATAQPLNFNDPSAVNSINNWAALKTNKKIPEIIDNISPDDLMYLINAIYFKGAWQYAFNLSDTYNGNFYLLNGSKTTVPFMRQELKANTYTDSLFSMIELPYGSGKTYSMYIILPNQQQQPAGRFASLINETVLENAISKMNFSSIQLNVPKWEYSYAVNDMRPALSMLGMRITFNDSADFSAMFNPGQAKPYITKAIHKTYIKVNEEGTEAAAVTAIGIGVTAYQPLVFKADHPFLYTIIEKQTGAILFAGIVNDPSKN